MPFKKLPYLFLFIVFSFAGFSYQTNAQDRERIVQDQPEQTNQRNSNENAQRQIPTLENKIVIYRDRVQKTSSSLPTNAPLESASKTKGFSAVLKSQMLKSIQKKLGLPYRYGSNGPRSYDCSSFVWSVFGDIGIEFTRTSARSYWQTFEPVSGDDRYKFGTLVFFNRLGHVGIVVDEEGFYHASTSKGVTYSKFEGYWEKRIVGYRRIPIEDYLYKTVSDK